MKNLMRVLILIALALLLYDTTACGQTDGRKIRMEGDGKCWQQDFAGSWANTTMVPCPRNVPTHKPTPTDLEWELQQCKEFQGLNSWSTRACIGVNCGVPQVTPLRSTVTTYRDGCRIHKDEFEDGSVGWVEKPTPTPTPFVCPKGYSCQRLPDVRTNHHLIFYDNTRVVAYTPTPEAR